MLLLALFLIFAILGVIFLARATAVRRARNADDTTRYRDVSLSDVGWYWTGLWCSVAAVVLFVGIFAITISGYSIVVGNEAKVDATRRNEAILRDRADVIGRTLRDYLTAQYPQYEQATIDKVLKAGPDLILLKFPELRTADTFIKYANDYKHLQSDVYAQATRRSDLQAKIASIRDNSLVFIPAVLP